MSRFVSSSRSVKLALVAGAAMLAATTAAKANLYTAVNGSASADITTANSTDVTIVLTNLTSADNTKSAANLLTGVVFKGVDIDTFSLQSQNADKGFNFTTQTTGSIDNTDFSPNWAIVAGSPGQLYFNGFGTGGHPIIGGPATGGTNYNHANTSLTSGPHGEYVYETATYVLHINGAFNVNTITGVTFLFNTNGDTPVDGTCPDCGGATPEPASLGVLGLGALGFLARRRKETK